MTRLPWLVALMLLVVFLLAASRGLHEPDEGRYVEIAREMAVSGDFLVPRLKGVPHYAKPPLTYWAIAASLKLFGMQEWAARLPGFLAAVVTLLASASLARSLGGSCIMTAFLLGCTLEFFALAQIPTTDMLLCTFVVLAWLARWRSLHTPHLKWRLLFWLSVALGLLTKGPIILMVVLAGFLATSLFSRSLWIFRGLGWSWGLTLAFLAALPWYVLVVQRQEGLMDYFLGEEVLARVRSGMGRKKPIYYFLIVYPLVLLPWSSYVWQGWKHLAGHQRNTWCFLAGWMTGPFLVFSLSASKLWTYMLPLVPPAILMASLAVSEKKDRLRSIIATGLVFFLLMTGAVLWAEANPHSLGNNSGYRSFLLGLHVTRAVGQPLECRLEPAREPPSFASVSGTRMATYRFHCHAASFYLMGARPEFVPIYGKGSLWEWQSMKDRDHPGTLEDLARALRAPGAMIVLTKARFRRELEEALGRPLRLVHEDGQGSQKVVALHN